MKQMLVRLGVTLGLLGATWLTPLSSTGTRALALTEEQVLQKLRQVPVFTITNSQGAPLVASVPNSQNNSNNANNASVTGVFISRSDAQAFVETLKTQNPQLGNSVRVTPVSLADIYKMSQENRNKPERLMFDIIPVKDQVDSAMTLLREDGQQLNEFPGIPLFFATGGNDKGYLTIQRGNQQAIPFFFNKEDLMNLLNRYRQQQQNQLPEVEIEVVGLEQLIQILLQSNDADLNQIVLIPPRDTLEYIRSLQNNPANQTQPLPGNALPQAQPRPGNNQPQAQPRPGNNRPQAQPRNSQPNQPRR